MLETMLMVMILMTLMVRVRLLSLARAEDRATDIALDGMQDDNALRPSSEASSAPPEAEVSSTQVVKNAENPQPMTETVLGYGNCSMA